MRVFSLHFLTLYINTPADTNAAQRVHQIVMFVKIQIMNDKSHNVAPSRRSS